MTPFFFLGCRGGTPPHVTYFSRCSELHLARMNATRYTEHEEKTDQADGRRKNAGKRLSADGRRGRIDDEDVRRARAEACKV